METFTDMPRGKKAGIPNTFKVSMPEIGTVIGKKDENFKEIFQKFQESVLHNVMSNYKKGVDLATLIRTID